MRGSFSSTGDREALLLTARQSVATLADDGVVALVEGDDPVVDVRCAGRRLDLRIGGVGPAVGDVVADRGVEEVALLGDHPDGRGDAGLGEPAQVGTVEGDRAPRRVVQPRHQVADRRLAGTAGADDRGELAGGDAEVDAAQRPGHGRVVGAVGLVGEPHVVQRDLTADAVQGQHPRPRCVDDVGLQVEVGEHPVEQRHRPGHLRRGVQGLRDRHEEAHLQGGHRDDRAGGQAVVTPPQLDAGQQVDRDRGDREEGRDHREERPADQLLTDRELRQAFVLCDVPRGRAALAAEHLGEQRSGDRQRLLGERGHVRQRDLGLPRQPSADLPDAAGEPDEQRRQGEGEQGELPGQHRHRDDRADQRDGVGQDRARGVGDDRLQAADVVGQPALDVPGPGGGEEAEGQGLQVGVEPRPQVSQHPLPDGVGEVALPDTDQRAHDRGRDHQRQQLVEQAQLRSAGDEQRPVEDLLDQQRSDDAEPAGHDDQQSDDDQLVPVGREQARDAAQQRAVRQRGRHTRAGRGQTRRPTTTATKPATGTAATATRAATATGSPAARPTAAATRSTCSAVERHAVLLGDGRPVGRRTG